MKRSTSRTPRLPPTVGPTAGAGDAGPPVPGIGAVIPGPGDTGPAGAAAVAAGLPTLVSGAGIVIPALTGPSAPVILIAVGFPRKFNARISSVLSSAMAYVLIR